MLGSHHIPDIFFRNIFIGGLYLFVVRLYVRDFTSARRENAFALAKAWEDSRVEDQYTFDNYDYNPYDQPKND